MPLASDDADLLTAIDRHRITVIWPRAAGRSKSTAQPDLKKLHKAIDGAFELGVHTSRQPQSMQLNFVMAAREVAYIGTPTSPSAGSGEGTPSGPPVIGIVTRDPVVLRSVVETAAAMPGSRMGERLSGWRSAAHRG